MALREHIRFIYNEAAVVVTINGKNYLIIGDLHIGAERDLVDRGVRIYNAVEQMTAKIKLLVKEFGIDCIVVLGDVKDSVLYPDKIENSELREFFKELEPYKIIVTAGNHDPHLGEIVECEIADELVIGGYAFLHGHRWPSEAAMRAKYIFAGHNHIAVSIKDKNGAFYNQKAWLVAKFNKRKGLERYPDANTGIVLVVLPAFNDLIIGMPVNKKDGKNLSPLFRSKIFGYGGATVYSLRGELIGKVSKISKL